ncbi:MAG: carbonic anhydrase [Bacteroidota bacterium]
MTRLVSISTADDIFPAYRETPIGRLIEYHNLGRAFEAYSTAELLVGMCMDNRNQLRIPNNFAFIIRAGGGNLRYSGFKVSFAIAIGGVKTIALIGHTHCGMVHLETRKEQFVRGLVENAGWDTQRAEEHFKHFSPMFEIDDEIGFVLSEAKRLRMQYPKILVAPMLYRVEDNLLYLLNE